MNDELIALVERASAQTAPWLGQKRQLALRLFDRLAAGAPALLADWQTDPDLGVEQGTSRGGRRPSGTTALERGAPIQ